MSRPQNQQELDQAIYNMKEAQIKRLVDLQKEYNKEMPDDGIESLEDYREPLGMDVIKEVNILLSWGGSSDGYKLKFNSDNELMSGVYWYSDWGTYSEKTLTDEQLDIVTEIYMYGDPECFIKNYD